MDVDGIEVEVVRSSRRTLGLQIKDGRVIARAPLRMPVSTIRSFVTQKRGWIEKHLHQAERRRAEEQAHGETADLLSGDQIHELARQACEDLPARVERYAPQVGVSYGRITIRLQKTRWGSCSSKGNLNFNCLLMLAPQEVRDYVVVHELCHRKEMNHSARFWAEVARVLPGYEAQKRWLKDHGSALMRRAGL